MNEQRIKDC